jgi:hypothetical protein
MISLYSRRRHANRSTAENDASKVSQSQRYGNEEWVSSNAIIMSCDAVEYAADA